MLLSQVLNGYDYSLVKGTMEIEVNDVIYDSRKIVDQTVFVCMSGATFDAHNYISEAVKKGAVAIVIERDVEELWLCPRNYLMLARNIKNQLIKLTNSTVLIQEIEKNNDDLKFTISKYDAELKLIADTAENKSIIVGNDVFKFLELYGFEVYSVEDNDLFIQSDYTNAKTNLTNKKNSYIFLLDTDSINENTQKMIDAGAEVIYINSLITRTDEENQENYTYTNMMDNL